MAVIRMSEILSQKLYDGSLCLIARMIASQPASLLTKYAWYFDFPWQAQTIAKQFGSLSFGKRKRGKRAVPFCINASSHLPHILWRHCEHALCSTVLVKGIIELNNCSKISAHVNYVQQFVNDKINCRVAIHRISSLLLVFHMGNYANNYANTQSTNTYSTVYMNDKCLLYVCFAWRFIMHSWH